VRGAVDDAWVGPLLMAEPDDPSDLSWALHAVRSGDESAFAALYRHLQPRLLRYATALVGPDAEDVTAETWLHVARDLRHFTGDLDGFRGWVSTICRNRAVDLMRTRSRMPPPAPEAGWTADHPGPTDTAEEAMDAIGTREAIAMIAALPRREAEAVLLRAVVGLDVRTTGAVLGQRAGAVRVAAHRGLKRLARQLDDRRRQAGGTDA
jgi:RNA polymerase sigma-70 factor, ECF subfamily